MSISKTTPGNWMHWLQLAVMVIGFLTYYFNNEKTTAIDMAVINNKLDNLSKGVEEIKSNQINVDRRLLSLEQSKSDNTRVALR